MLLSDILFEFKVISIAVYGVRSSDVQVIACNKQQYVQTEYVRVNRNIIQIFVNIKNTHQDLLRMSYVYICRS